MTKSRIPASPEKSTLALGPLVLTAMIVLAALSRLLAAMDSVRRLPPLLHARRLILNTSG